jgi:putative DNA methylase
MAKEQPWKDKGMKKAEWLAEEVAKAVGAGKPWDCETVDFSDPDRPPTCIEVDFPIVPINKLAAIEGSSGSTRKPIYQITKWWARRNSSVFRTILLAAATRAPADPTEAAKIVWNTYYGNFQKKDSLKNLKVADIFMGGGTTVIEGSRLGMQMHGNDLNPVAWFVVKNALTQADEAEVEDLLADIEAEVKPQIMPFYACDCPRGHKGKWTQISTGEIMGDAFDPVSLSPEQRKGYRYEGPEIIYVFWIKHGPCQVTGCGHRTPIMTSPVIATKTLSVKAWACKCRNCGNQYDLEEHNVRMAPEAALVVAETERPFAVPQLNKWSKAPENTQCPCCGKNETFGKLGKGRSKKIKLSLLVHPKWLQGEAAKDVEGRPLGGSVNDLAEETIRWNLIRATHCSLIEVRGKLPDEIKCPDTDFLIRTGREGGTVPGKSKFACAACGTVHDILTAVKASKTNGFFAAPLMQGYCKACKQNGESYNGRFFATMDSKTTNAAEHEWLSRRTSDCETYWPTEELPYGLEADFWSVRHHGYTHWWKMFNSRQLLVHSLLIKEITNLAKQGRHSKSVSDYVLGSFQQYLRNNCMFTIWNTQADQLEPQFAKNNFRPKTQAIENNVYGHLGRGNWKACSAFLSGSLKWRVNPWDLAIVKLVTLERRDLEGDLKGKSFKVSIGDSPSNDPSVTCCSSTDLGHLSTESFDLVITDPPFGDLLQYSELSDFFYVWLSIYFKNFNEPSFNGEETPKSLEAVANKARQENPDNFYQRLLTACWKEANRILKIGGTLVFTFHHSEDKPWVSVLESLFDGGFFLEATYPIRSDETKGDNAEFGSQKIEYDIIHVCRKRDKEPKPISWAKLRRQVLRDVRELQNLLEHHQEEGLPEADLQVIRRGKALEYFSRHYGKVYKNQDTPMTVLEALIGINQLLDEEAGGIKEPPPHNAEPFTRMLLRLFDGISELPRDQIQKFLRGTGSAPSDYISRGWVHEEKKVFYLTPPLDLARSWVGKKRKGMTSDYDQAMFFIGACFEGSGINANDTLNNANFRPHPSLGAILIWFKNHGDGSPTRNAAIMASQLYHHWEAKNQPKVKQLSLFENLGEEEF